jgi:hypothetical protein
MSRLSPMMILAQLGMLPLITLMGLGMGVWGFSVRGKGHL